MRTYLRLVLVMCLLLMLVVTLFATRPIAAQSPVTLWHNNVAFSTGSGWAWKDDWGCCGRGTEYHVGDFNGDSKADLLFYYPDPTNASITRFVVARSNGSSLVYSGSWLTLGPNTARYTGDFNGDGKTDLLVTYFDNTNVWRNLVCTSNGAAFSACSNWMNDVGQGTEYHVGNLDGIDTNGKKTDDLMFSYRDSNGSWHFVAALSTGSSFTFSGSWLTLGPNTARYTGDFNGDGKTDLLVTYFDNTNVWRNLVCTSNGAAFSACSNWIDNVGQGVRYYVGNFDGTSANGKKTDDLLLSYRDSNGYWHNIVVASTGSTFSWQGDWGCCGAQSLYNAGIAYYLGDFSGDGKSDLLAAYGQTVPAGFAYVVGNKLKQDGQDIFVKGANYLGGRYIPQFVLSGSPVENYSLWHIFHEFDAAKIEEELLFLKNNLGINTVRLFTPGRKEWYPYVDSHHWPDWFNSDGSINTLYLGELQAFLDLAQRNGIKVQLELMHGVHGREWTCSSEMTYKFCGTKLPTYTDPQNAPSLIPPGSAEEQFYLNYLRSLLPALKNNPTILAYEVENENLINFDINWWQDNWFNQRSFSYMTRMIREVRRLDPNHLVTSGEVVSAAPKTVPAFNSLWHYPSPEFAAIPDIHSLNGATPYTLYSLVDFVSPHLYGKTDDVSLAISVLTERRATMSPQKPITLGEFGFAYEEVQISSDGTVRNHFPKPPPSDLQKDYFDALLSASCANSLNGYQAWAPLRIFDVYTYTMVIASQRPVPNTNITDVYYAPVLTLPTSPQRTIKGYSLTWHLFDANRQLLPAATSFKNATC